MESIESCDGCLLRGPDSVGKRTKVLFAIGLWGPLSCAYPLKMTRENNPVIPTGAAVKVIHTLSTDSPTG